MAAHTHPEIAQTELSIKGTLFHYDELRESHQSVHRHYKAELVTNGYVQSLILGRHVCRTKLPPKMF